MRVLVLSSLYPPQALGGYERSCADVMSRFRARGHDVTVLTTDTRLPDVADEPDEGVRRELRWYWADHRLLQPSLAGRHAVERHNRTTLDRALRDARPDVVSVWSMGAMSLGLIERLNTAGLPTVYVVCDEWPVYGPRLDAWLAGFRSRAGRVAGPVVRRLTGLPVRMPTPADATFLWLSTFVRDRVLGATGWRPAHETVTYSGIETREFPVEVAPDGPRPWRWRLLYVGRVEPRKGIDTAVKALVGLPAYATLRIVGPDDGNHAGELRALADRLGVGDRVRIGPVPRPELRTVYADADAFLFTSAWEEPFGLTPLEAMACGTPVVAAATGGAAEYLSDGVNCLVVPPREPGAITEALRRLVLDADLRTALVSGGVDTAQRFTVDRLADVMERWHLAAADHFHDGDPT